MASGRTIKSCDSLLHGPGRFEVQPAGSAFGKTKSLIEALLEIEVSEQK